MTALGGAYCAFIFKVSVTCYVSDSSVDSGLTNMFCIADVGQKTPVCKYTKNLLICQSTSTMGDVGDVQKDKVWQKANCRMTVAPRSARVSK